MKLTLSSKLFVAVQALCTFAVLAMGFAAYLSFTHGFLGYLNDQAVERLRSTLPRFEQAWTAHGDWEYLRNNGHGWFELIRPEPPAGKTTFYPGTPPISDLTGAILRFTLLDSQKHYVAGYTAFDRQAVLVPIAHDDQVVGWLAMTPFETVSATGDSRFQLNQIRSSLLIGLICLLISAVIAWWITHQLLQPVKRVALATRRLAAGDYSTVLPETGNDEAAQLARDFNGMAATLASNEQQRRGFMADISHELRTPLAILRAELEAIEDGIRVMDGPALRSLQGEVMALSKLVDDLFELSLAELGGPAYRRDPVDIGALLGMAVDAYATRFAERQLSLHLQGWPQPLLVLGDDAKLVQLFYNLLENSLRYTDAGGAVNLRMGRFDDQVCIDFQDSAPGVPLEQQKRLFERFYRVENSRSRSSGGAGLGLAICRGIAQVHGGELSAQSSPFGGLWLTLRLPALEEQA
ncbi:ATP-binding protein [Pseudomonas sp. HR96]|uniref:ATP-binding protein n=1 Tax=Pseudomonas sp. HR96 TaxID=1027966 RepID=UPI002A750890|nr:ATP-binding protein [Pseudomonas sp. HR96]WPP01343.1 ATP-binding protein [Pseudomonas sp. HR96]